MRTNNFSCTNFTFIHLAPWFPSAVHSDQCNTLERSDNFRLTSLNSTPWIAVFISNSFFFFFVNIYLTIGSLCHFLRMGKPFPMIFFSDMWRSQAQGLQVTNRYASTPNFFYDKGDFHHLLWDKWIPSTVQKKWSPFRELQPSSFTLHPYLLYREPFPIPTRN